MFKQGIAFIAASTKKMKQETMLKYSARVLFLLLIFQTILFAFPSNSY